MNQDSSHDQQNTSSPRKVHDEQRSVAEWTTLGISVLIIAGMAVAISWLHFRGDERPPILVVETHIDAMREDDSGFYVPVTITNTGSITVAEAQVEGELDSGSGEPEMAEITVDFLAGGESVEGTFIFRSDPTQGDLTTGATSYQDP